MDRIPKKLAEDQRGDTPAPWDGLREVIGPLCTGEAARTQFAVLLIGLLLISGCSIRTTTFDVVDYRQPGEARRYRETFDEAYYDLDDHGNVDIVLRRREPGTADPDRSTVQVIHIRSVWRSIPGNTVADRTQINGTVSYMIISGSTGAAFEGAGAVFFRQNRQGDTLTGTLDHASLKPKRRLAGGGAFFERAVLSGEFHASRDPGRVVRIANEMNRLFGPSPSRKRQSSAAP